MRVQEVVMVRHLFLIALIAPALFGGDLAEHPAVREMSWQLLSETRFGFSHQEQAAFVVRSGDGYRCVAWPSDGLADGARWEGRYPEGVIAIIHTHPNWMSAPSPIDARTARTARIPVYVITRSKITKTTGAGSEVIVTGDWKPSSRERVCGTSLGGMQSARGLSAR